jgi:hypothetical protein
MHQFPDEDARSAEVQENLAELFNLAESSFNYWFDQDKNNGGPACRCSPPTWH